MPYRRLPNTDAARIAALEAIAELKEDGYQDDILSAELLQSAETQLSNFRNLQDLYRQAVEMWQDNNLIYRDIIPNLTTHINNFVRAFHLAVESGEIRKESSFSYRIEHNEIPDLSTEEKILDWGKRLIDGERKRIFEGGAPITNPTIASLSIYYDKLKELNFNQQIKRNYIEHTKKKLNAERDSADALIKKIWNTVEEAFSHLPDNERIECAKTYGVVYYERPSERAAKEDINEQKTQTTEPIANEISEHFNTPIIEEAPINELYTELYTIQTEEAVVKEESTIDDDFIIIIDDTPSNTDPNEPIIEVIEETKTEDNTDDLEATIVEDCAQNEVVAPDDDNIIIIDLPEEEKTTTTVNINQKSIPIENKQHSTQSKQNHSRIKSKYNDVPEIPFGD